VYIHAIDADRKFSSSWPKKKKKSCFPPTDLTFAKNRKLKAVD
jgi:hypothetical protein